MKKTYSHHDGPSAVEHHLHFMDNPDHQFGAVKLRIQDQLRNTEKAKQHKAEVDAENQKHHAEQLAAAQRTVHAPRRRNLNQV